MWPSAQENLIVMLTSFPQLPRLHGCNRVWLTNVYGKCTNKWVTRRQPAKCHGICYNWLLIITNINFRLQSHKMLNISFFTTKHNYGQLIFNSSSCLHNKEIMKMWRLSSLPPEKEAGCIPKLVLIYFTGTLMLHVLCDCPSLVPNRQQRLQSDYVCFSTYTDQDYSVHSTNFFAVHKLLWINLKHSHIRNSACTHMCTHSLWNFS